MPSSRATFTTRELSGGSKRAAARSLNTCPYRAMYSPLCPQTYRAIEATTIVRQGPRRASATTPLGTVAMPVRFSLQTGMDRDMDPTTHQRIVFKVYSRPPTLSP